MHLNKTSLYNIFPSLDPHDKERNLKVDMSVGISVTVTVVSSAAYLNVLAVLICHHDFYYEVFHVRCNGLFVDVLHELAKLHW